LIWGIVAKETAEQAFEMLGAGGTARVIGMIPEGTRIELEGGSFLRRGERKVQGSYMASNRFRVDMPRYVEFTDRAGSGSMGWRPSGWSWSRSTRRSTT